METSANMTIVWIVLGGAAYIAFVLLIAGMCGLNHLEDDEPR